MKRLLLLALVCISCEAWVKLQIPAGTILPVHLSTSLDSRKIKAGKRITARVEQDVPTPQGKIPSGSKLEGKVVRADEHSAVLEFDTLRTKKESIPIRVSLRAIAAPTDVDSAQLPISNIDDRGSPSSAWTTRQVGGEIVYRGGGHVLAGMKRVGEPVPDGVLGRLRPSKNELCRGEIYGDETPAMALWVFSTDACGVYGYSGLEITHDGRTDPTGQIELTAEKNVRLYPGTGLLLRVLPTE